MISFLADDSMESNGTSANLLLPSQSSAWWEKSPLSRAQEMDGDADGSCGAPLLSLWELLSKLLKVKCLHHWPAQKTEMCCSTSRILKFLTLFHKKKIVLVAYDLLNTGKSPPIYYFTYAQLWVAYYCNWVLFIKLWLFFNSVNLLEIKLLKSETFPFRLIALNSQKHCSLQCCFP